MGNKWFDIDLPENDLDLSEFEEDKYFEFLEQGYSEDESVEMARKVTEEKENEIREMRRCCPKGCRGLC